MTSYLLERSVGIKAVLLASKLCTSVFKQLVSTDSINKKDNSPVTIADYGSQAIINSIISSEFPNDEIMGEEDSLELQNSTGLLSSVLKLTNSIVNPPFSQSELINAIDRGNGNRGNKRFWTLDPIDGTKGFLRGQQFAVCLALIEDEKVQVSIIGCPNLHVDMHDLKSSKGCLFVAVRNHGAYQINFDNPEKEIKIQSSPLVDTLHAKFCESVEAAHSSHSDASAIALELGITNKSLQIDSQVKYAIVARGESEIYLRIPIGGMQGSYVENIWDHASGALLVEEAGGKVSDCLGKNLDFTVGRKLENNKGIVVTNGHIHNAVVDAVLKVVN